MPIAQYVASFKLNSMERPESLKVKKKFVTEKIGKKKIQTRNDMRLEMESCPCNSAE